MAQNQARGASATRPFRRLKPHHRAQASRGSRNSECEGPAVPGHQQHRVLRQRGDDEAVQIRQRAQGGTGQQGGAAVAGGGCGGGEGAA